MRRRARQQAPLVGTPEAIAAWAKRTREELHAQATDTIETVADAMCAEANAGRPDDSRFRVPRESMVNLLRLWIATRAHPSVEEFYPKSAARIRAFVAQEQGKKL